MERGLFNWAVITALVSSLLFFVVGMFTTNDLIILGLVVVLALVSIIVYSKKAEGSFITGAFLGLIVFVMLAVVEGIRNWMGFGGFLFMFAIVFFIGGFIGKWSSKDKEKLHKRIYFWVMIGALVAGIVIFVLSLVFARVGYLTPPVEPIVFICGSDESCGEGYVCVDGTCLYSGLTTMVYDFEGGIGSWYGDTECASEVDSDPCWHIEYEEDGNAVIEGWEHIWLYSTIEFSRIDSLETKIMMRDGAFHLNFIDTEEEDMHRYFLSMETDGLMLSKQIGEEFDDYQSVDYEFENDKWYDLRIEIDGAVTVYVNDELVLSDVMNQEYNKAIVTLETLEGSSVWLDDIMVEGELYVDFIEVEAI